MPEQYKRPRKQALAQEIGLLRIVVRNLERTPVQVDPRATRIGVVRPTGAMSCIVVYRAGSGRRRTCAALHHRRCLPARRPCRSSARVSLEFDGKLRRERLDELHGVVTKTPSAIECVGGFVAHQHADLELLSAEFAHE
jgi:hypothetical protein